MLDRTAAPATVRGEYPSPERAETLAVAEPEDSPREYALEQLRAVFASGLEE